MKILIVDLSITSNSELTSTINIEKNETALSRYYGGNADYLPERFPSSVTEECEFHLNTLKKFNPEIVVTSECSDRLFPVIKACRSYKSAKIVNFISPEFKGIISDFSNAGRYYTFASEIYCRRMTMLTNACDLTIFNDAESAKYMTKLGIDGTKISQNPSKPNDLFESVKTQKGDCSASKITDSDFKLFEIFMSIYNSEDNYNTIIDYLQHNRFNKVLLYGAGPKGVSFLRLARNSGIEVDAFLDSNPQKWGSIVDGVAVKGPKDIDKNNSIIVITSTFKTQILDNLLKMDVPLDRIVF